MKRARGFTLIGVVILVVLFAVFVGSVCYVLKHAVVKAQTIEAHRQRQLTNELVEPFPREFPEDSEWILDPGEVPSWTDSGDGQLVLEIPDNAASNLFASVGAWRVEWSGSATGAWAGNGWAMTGTLRSVRGVLLELLRVEAQQCPYPSHGFYRMTRE